MLYGILRTSDFDSLSRDAFIYEYVGDVVNPVSFKKRMREYAEEGIRHFYFMMLQKDEVSNFVGPIATRSSYLL